MKGFNSIRDRLNLDEQITEPSSDNVGCSELVDAVFAFNHQVSDTKNKYKKKTENLRDFLENVGSARKVAHFGSWPSMAR